MCGFAGIYDPHGRVEPSVLRAMQSALAHRGPDGEGAWVHASGTVGLAHRRLAILDLSPAGLQPMAGGGGALQLVYNGEIYNYRELGRELEALGYTFRSQTDTEVLLRGLEAWGLDVLPRLRGMFAFALWDDAAGTLTLVRDRMGIKPLYVHPRPSGGVVFASEIKAVLEHPEVPRRLDPAAAWHYLSFYVPPPPLTMFEGIYKVPAGHVLRVRGSGSWDQRRWWDPEPGAGEDPAVYEDEQRCAGRLLELLEQATLDRMVADVPFGAYLSGGLDSSLNVALMARHLDRPVDTFSVGFPGHADYDETPHARTVASYFGTRHHEVRVEERDLLDYLPELIVHQDEPIGDWVCVPLHYLSRSARQAGVIVVQVGEGSDELFCGYEHFVDAVKQHRHYERILGPLPRPIRGAARDAARVAARWSDRWRGRAALMEEIAEGHELFWGGAVAYRDDRKRPLWAGPEALSPLADDRAPEALRHLDSNAVVRWLLEPFRRVHPQADYYQQMLYLELRMRLPELLLMRVDKITMAQSVEARVPFLDHRLVNFAMGLPHRFRVRKGERKAILRKAAGNLLPESVLRRPKQGFGAPVPEWLRGPLGKVLEARLASTRLEILQAGHLRRLLEEHRRGVADHSVPLWLSLNLLLWYDHWIDPPAAA